jgi:Leu/Phe-tRNA-protein transferase
MSGPKKLQYLRYTPSGHIFIGPDDDCDAVAWLLQIEDYKEDFCLAKDFDPEFVARLMAAGFLVMSAVLRGEKPGEPDLTILLPKHHLIRSCLFFPDLHIKKSIRSKLPRYELRFDADFDLILGKCLETHGDAWLTPPLTAVIRKLRGTNGLPARPVSFGLYREGKLAAGEFGIVTGRVYTSYSGFKDETGAGTAQMLLTAGYLEKAGYAFWDLGMPLDYKLTLGAREIGREDFMKRFYRANGLLGIKRTCGASPTLRHE